MVSAAIIKNEEQIALASFSFQKKNGTCLQAAQELPKSEPRLVPHQFHGVLDQPIHAGSFFWQRGLPKVG